MDDIDDEAIPEASFEGPEPGSALHKTRTRISRSLVSLVAGGALCGVFAWLYQDKHSPLVGAAAFLFGLGPALSGLKNLIQGILELRAWRKTHS